MAKPFTKTEKAIAKQLGLTPFALSVLTRHTTGRTDNNGGVAGDKLRAAGYLESFKRVVGGPGGGYMFERSRITDAGRALVAQARRMGW